MTETCTHLATIKSVGPSGNGCVECLAMGGRWVHLRRCVGCGHIGCCDSSPSQHGSEHAKQAKHPFMTSYEPGESWFWNVDDDQFYDGPALAAPEHHPLEQTVPGPADRVPRDWSRYLH
jgi:Zn-finger in ubiquitin-hydrolases and other protein